MRVLIEKALELIVEDLVVIVSTTSLSGIEGVILQSKGHSIKPIHYSLLVTRISKKCRRRSHDKRSYFDGIFL